MQRRRALADEHAERARDAAAQAGEPGAAGHDARARALRDVTRALAFDPEHRGAVGTLVRLLVEPPAESPPEVLRAIEESEQGERREGARLAVISNTTWLLFASVGTLYVRDWRFAGVALGLIAACVAYALWIRRRIAVTAAQTLTVLALNSAAIAAFSGIFGPLFFVPAIALANHVFFALLGGVRGRRLAITALAVGTFVVPWLLEVIGALPPSYEFTGAGLLIRARMLTLSPAYATAFLLLTSLANTAMSIFLADRVRSIHMDAQRRLLLQSWQLRQMVPSDPSAPA
jgi:serine/threonine-protein kinase